MVFLQVFAETGTNNQVGQIVSAERGELVTFVGILNAVGDSIPPVFIFPLVRYKDAFLKRERYHYLHNFRITENSTVGCDSVLPFQKKIKSGIQWFYGKQSWANYIYIRYS